MEVIFGMALQFPDKGYIIRFFRKIPRFLGVANTWNKFNLQSKMNKLYLKPLSRRQSYLYNKQIKAMKGFGI